MIMATIVHRDNISCCNDIIIARTNYIGLANIYKENILRTHATVLAISQIPSILYANTVFMPTVTMTTTNLSVVGSGPT